MKDQLEITKTKHKLVTTRDYQPSAGNLKSNKPNRRELVGYLPLEKRLAALKMAGLNTAYDKDKRYFDLVKGEEDIEFMPPLPRHIPADLSEVSDVYHYYQDRRRELEQRVQETLKKKRTPNGAEGAGDTPTNEPPPGRSAVEGGS